MVPYLFLLLILGTKGRFTHDVAKREALCPNETISCKNPLNYEQTKQFMCNHDKKCPRGYTCCEDSCFGHKICKGGKPIHCGVDEIVCSLSLEYARTKQFLCYDDKQCPLNYRCCTDNCFCHKICKRVFASTSEGSSSTATIPTTTTITTQTSTVAEEDTTTETESSTTESSGTFNLFGSN